MNIKIRNIMTFALLCGILLSCTGCVGKRENTPVIPGTVLADAELTPSGAESEAGNIGGIDTEAAPVTDSVETVGTLDGLSTENTDWWFGANYDALNRPQHPLDEQKKFGKYSADFIRSETEEKIIYLTFDEGFENGYTPQILDILKAKNVKAVFFVTMPYVKGDIALVQRMINEGHIVGNHSVTHPAKGLPSQTPEQQTEEVMGVHNYIKENLGYTMNLFRYPAGKYSEQSLALLQQLGYRTVFWSFAYFDYDTTKQPDEAESLDRLVNRLHPGAIYLLHAISSTNTHILAEFIDQARAKGYTFAPYPA